MVYVNNPDHAHNANAPDFDAATPYKNGEVVRDYFNNIGCGFLTSNWGGWNNFFYQTTPLEKEKDLNTDGDPLSYHFKATHSGVINLILLIMLFSFLQQVELSS